MLYVSHELVAIIFFLSFQSLKAFKNGQLICQEARIKALHIVLYIQKHVGYIMNSSQF